MEVLKHKNRSIKKAVGDFEKALGKSFEDLRRQKQLRMVDVARMAGIAPSAYCQIENGTCSSRIEVVTRVAAALGIELVFRLVPDDAPLMGNNPVRPPIIINGKKNKKSRVDLAGKPQAKAKCVDILDRDVVVGDVMWNVKSNNLHETRKHVVQYLTSVRCPRPGEAIPEFEGWKKMAKAMQSAGAKFDLATLQEWVSVGCDFTSRADSYRRRPSCTWKATK